MSKTNFTKVEKAIDDGLQQIIIGNLLDLADAANAPKQPPVTLSPEQQAALLQTLDRNLKKLNKMDSAAYQKLSPLKNDIKKLMSVSENFTAEDWQKIKEIKEKIESYKKEISKNLPQPSDDQIIEEERIKHINKRFNINDNWLPLR
ncbi:hypothetical protein PHSC3_000196 [Chlamydiales bacterium STE3]|nr:hypothetical protein PHSC3_000196 [Chlamydiales bacterium STE3]